MDKQTDPNQKENPQPNPPPFKIKFLDVLCVVYNLFGLSYFIIFIHNKNYDTKYKVLFEDFLSNLSKTYFVILLIVSTFMMFFSHIYLMYRYNNYIKIYQPELYYKANYDIEFMKERAKKFQRRVLLMFLLGPIVLYFI